MPFLDDPYVSCCAGYRSPRDRVSLETNRNAQHLCAVLIDRVCEVEPSKSRNHLSHGVALEIVEPRVIEQNVDCPHVLSPFCLPVVLIGQRESQASCESRNTISSEKTCH